MKNNNIIVKPKKIFIRFFLKKITAGKLNNVIDKRLKLKKPKKFKLCKTSGNHDQLCAHKFHGNPDKTLLLK